ncbi:hypothetical protein, partial [Bosea sp. BK604]|uniref:hypothetical protein n=1 Tax=Bosea sp. BK604 TaxID=2512180 RepID=UPI001A9EFDF0
NLKVVGSNPAPATKSQKGPAIRRALFAFLGFTAPGRHECARSGGRHASAPGDEAPLNASQSQFRSKA